MLSMNNIFSFIFLIIIFSQFTCDIAGIKPHWQSVEHDGKYFNLLVLPNNINILCDNNFNLLNLEVSQNSGLKSKLSFYNNGQLEYKESGTSKGWLEGKNYSFYDNGDLKSIVTYKNGKKVDYGFDYYKNSGNLQNYIFYDTSGIYFYAESYSDTSIDVRYNFNPKNPYSYQLIKAKIPEPQKSQLLKIMEGIGLDSLKQIY